MRILSYIRTNVFGMAVLLGLFILSARPNCYAQTDYFIQDFTYPVGYTSTTPNNTQFNVLVANNNSSIVFSGGKMIITRVTTPAQAFFARNTNFSPVPSTLYLEVDINVPLVTSPINGAAIFNIGQNLATNGTANPNADLFARFSINLGANNTFQIRNVSGGGSTIDSPTFPSSQTVKVIVAMNNGSKSTTYFDPRNARAPQIVLQPGTYDIWVNNVPLVLGRGKVAGPAGNVTLTNFNFLFNSGGGSIVMDNLRIRDISGVLPVNLTYFTAQPIGQQVELGWETAWEKNSREFVVQRSSDLQEFGDLGSIAAAGETDGRRQYSFTDMAPLPGVNYYRLRMVDKDGTYEYSKVRDVIVHSDQPTLWVTPNPTTGERIRFRASSVDISALKLTTISGQNINFRINQGSDGYTELIPHSVLSPGMYFLILNQDGFRSHTKVLVQ
ncbi:T9SS type A sorting domain-containing protein [Salmonirosea aquatica]|uniref:T9SS type A sorting domain-containing protein n=1 Tax=Salmonirosea aquatica TaxID=2654236 RepID=A0A7C9BIZ9_9BACT|nr:T9SS type A sorting domain-containing protein [Cytophagaceae bacterium SJW1-29]